jgi:ABC-2 type transport system ATP-binding protein
MNATELVAPKAPTAAPSAEAIVSVRGLTKVFKDFWGRSKARAVDNVDFEVRRGEVFGLLGPNGSGKSTTVKLLLGLLYPTKGHIEVFGHSPRHVATKARIGYLPEESYLYRYLNSRETLDFFGNLFHLEKGDRERRAEQLLEMVGLSKVHLRSVGEFSKGMSSHLLSDVQDVCDRVVIYYGGRVQAMGPLKDLLATPDAIQITTPALKRETMEQVLEILRRDVAEDKVRVDAPSQNLESYFLEVVQRARQASAETSGATSGSQVAAYLRGTETAQPAPDKLLERLLQTAPAAPAPTPEVVSAGPTVDQAKLQALTQAQAPAAKPQTAVPKKVADLDKANEKLSSLLGNQDK